MKEVFPCKRGEDVLLYKNAENRRSKHNARLSKRQSAYSLTEPSIGNDASLRGTGDQTSLHPCLLDIQHAQCYCAICCKTRVVNE